jgi:Na+/melibiose symporter-like transporter
MQCHFISIRGGTKIFCSVDSYFLNSAPRPRAATAKSGCTFKIVHHSIFQSFKLRAFIMSDDFLGMFFPGYRRVDGDQSHSCSDENKKRTIEPCNPLKRENLGIAMAYFFIEFIFSVIDTPLNVYMVKTLNAEPAMQSTIGILQTLPWSFKLLFGFVSDFYPIYNTRRISYLIIGIIVYSGSLLSYTVVGVDSVVFLSVCMFIATLGLIQIDVVADAMCVERSKFELEDEKGRMQAACYSIRFAGGLVGAVIGATVCNKDRWGWGLTFHQMTLLNGVAPFVIIAPCIPW